MMTWKASMAELPLIAILRGLVPDEAEAIGGVLVDAGFRCLEVPLNSPRALVSMEILQRRFGDQALVGAGTVLNVRDVDAVAAAGGQIVISPNTSLDVIMATKARGLTSLPGAATPTEALSALQSGADGIKLFPAEMHSPGSLRAMIAVVNPGTAFFPVGGIDEQSLMAWRTAGAAGAGIGSLLFVPGRTRTEVGARALALARQWRSSSEP